MPRADEACLVSKTVTNFEPVFLYSVQTNEKNVKLCTAGEQYTFFIVRKYSIRISRLEFPKF